MKGLFFTEKQDIGAEHQPIDMAYNELVKKKYEIPSVQIVWNLRQPKTIKGIDILRASTFLEELYR